MRTSFRIFAGLTLCLFGIFGCIYSICVASAQKLYYSVEYGILTNASPAVIEAACIKAHNLYPHNYNLSVRASRILWPLIFADDVVNDELAIDKVELWCNRGLAENPYHLALRYRKAELLSLSSATEAADYWAEFTAWQFWSSQNLSLLVKYYANAGRFVEATEVLSLLKGHADHKKASSILRKAWADEMRL